MKLADLRKQLRLEGAPLAEFVPAPPEPANVDGPIKGRKADVAIIDDPLVDDERKKKLRADFKSEVLGEWVDAPKGEDLPPTLGAMLADGTVTWDNTAPNRIAGQLVYELENDDLCEVKSRDEREGVALVWRGERNPETNQPIIRRARLDKLFVVKTTACRNCAGETRWAGRRGIAMKCKQCEGLGRVPTREALAPFKKRDAI